MDELLKSKCDLYRLLINIDESIITDTELNIMYELSKDKQVQNFLNLSK